MTENGISENAGFDLAAFCAQCAVPSPALFIKAASRLYEMLAEANRLCNLTRINSIPDYWNKHIADSIYISVFFPEIAREKLSLADIGCGAGFPSLPLAMAFPSLDVTAIDSTGKKTAFVERAKAELGLKNLTVLQARACELNRRKDWQNRFGIIAARAVSSASDIFNETSSMLKKNGKTILYKTPEKAMMEMDEVSKMSSKYGLKWKTTEPFELPAGDGRRIFLYSFTDAS